MPSAYIEERENNYFAQGSRVSLDSVVYGFLQGDSPETIRDNFPTLTLELVYGAIAFYLGHQSEIAARCPDADAGEWVNQLRYLPF